MDYDQSGKIYIIYTDKFLNLTAYYFRFKIKRPVPFCDGPFTPEIGPSELWEKSVI